MLWIYLFAGVCVIWIFGPRARLKDKNKIFTKRLLEGEFSDLHKLSAKQACAYILKQESKFPDLVDQAQTTIKWFDEPKKQENVVVFIHGFSATNQEISPVPENIATSLNANLLKPRLHGHGRHSKFMGESTAEDWLTQMWESINLAACLGNKVILIGNSTGATLITWLMQQKELIHALPCEISSLVYVSPNFGVKHKAVSLLTLPWAKYWMGWLGPSHKINHPKNAMHAKFWTSRYSIKSVYPLQVLIDWVRQSNLKLITTPALFVYNEFDPVVDPNTIHRMFKRFGSTNKKEEVWRIRQDHKSRHVIGGDIVAKENNQMLTNTILDFLNPILLQNTLGTESLASVAESQNESLVRDLDSNYDVVVIGGGINGVASAWQLAQNGQKVLLLEKDDIAGKTSSNSSKLIHGGLRYLEQKEFKMVRNALKEREKLMNLAPYLVRPISFLIPKTSFKTFWLFRMGLWVYDHLYFKRHIKSSKKIKLTKWHGFLKSFKSAMRYYDCQCDDARLVVELCKSSRQMGVDIRPQMHIQTINSHDSFEQAQWSLQVKDKLTGVEFNVFSNVIINAAGPWANEVHKTYFNDIYPLVDQKLRLVRGSHFLVKKISSDAFLLPNEDDGRIVFVLPYQEYSIVGTTEVEQSLEDNIEMSDQEKHYLLEMINKFIESPLKQDDIVASYAGIRPLIEDDSSSDKALSREFKVKIYQDKDGKKPVLASLLGGKITTFRLLGLEVEKQLSEHLSVKTPIDLKSLCGSSLSVIKLEKRLHFAAPYLAKEDVTRLIRAYGQTCLSWFYGSEEDQLGKKFAKGVYQVEIDYLLKNEWVYDFEDLMKRRTRFDWSFTQAQKVRLEKYIQSYLALFKELSQSRISLQRSAIRSNLGASKLLDSQIDQSGHQGTGL